MIDKQKFNELFQQFDKDFILEILEIAAKDIPERIEAIAKNIEDVDFEGLGRNACTIKGTLSNFCDPVSTGLACQLWDHVRSRKPELENRTMDDKILQMFSELKTATELLVDELKLIKQELTSG